MNFYWIYFQTKGKYLLCCFSPVFCKSVRVQKENAVVKGADSGIRLPGFDGLESCLCSY